MNKQRLKMMLREYGIELEPSRPNEKVLLLKQGVEIADLYEDASLLPRAPVVSVIVMVYNHAPWIRQALDSIVCQKCDFKFEIIVGDDHSSDGTTAILKEYQKEHADLVRLLVNRENHGAGTNSRNMMRYARGKYIAFLEGDDYWVGNERLARQVEILEKHGETQLVVGNTDIIRETTDGGMEKIGEIVRLRKECPTSADVMLQMYHLSTYVLRRDALDCFEAECEKYGSAPDLYLLYSATRKAPARYINEILSVRRVTGKGVYSSLDVRKKLLFDLMWRARIASDFLCDGEGVFAKDLFDRFMRIPICDRSVVSAAKMWLRLFPAHPLTAVLWACGNCRNVVKMVLKK